MLVLAGCGGAGGWIAVAIGPPAVADGIDVIAFILLGLLAGWALLIVLSSLRRLTAAWRDWRAGILLPVLMKEMRSSMRGLRTPALIMASAGLAAVAGIIFIAASWSDHNYSNDLMESTAALGENLVRLVFLLGAVIALLLAPAMTAGGVSREREGQTLEMLLLTRMSPGQIAWGKLLSGLGLLALLVLCVLPVAGIGFMLGGVAGWQLLAAAAMLAAGVLCFGAIGLWCSTRFRRTAVAMAVAYVLCGLLLIFTPLMTDMVIPLLTGGGDISVMIVIGMEAGLVIAAGILVTLCSLPSIRSRLPGWMRWASVPTGIIILLGFVLLNYSIDPDSTELVITHSRIMSHLASSDGYEYIEYIDPILAFGILVEPSGYFEYYLPSGEGYYAEFDEDWPIILTNIAVFLLIAKLMLALTARRLRRLRSGDRSKWQPSAKLAPPVNEIVLPEY